MGFFDKIQRAELFVMLDHVQYRKRYFQNRNRIRSADGSTWLTVPVKVKGKYEQCINEVRIDNEGNLRWREKCWNSLSRCYRKAPFFHDYSEFFRDLYSRDWEYLVDFNEAVIIYLLSALNIETRIMKSSNLNLGGRKADLMVQICRKVGATTYLSGISGKEYLDEASFTKHDIQLQFQEFYHPIYRQLYDPFLPCMSAVDLLFNNGPCSSAILSDAGVPRMEALFE